MFPDINKIPTRTVKIDKTDSINALMRLKWNDIAKTASTPNPYATIAIDHNGSTAAKLIVFLNIGTSATDYSQYQFSAYATGVTDPNGIDASPTHTQVTTLQALIKAINALNPDALKHTSGTPLGLWATRLNAPGDYSLDTDDFVDLTEVRMSPFFTDYLYQDVSEIVHCSYRLGVPDDVKGRVGNGKIEIIQIDGYVDSASGTDCTFKASYDPNETDYTKEVELALTRSVPDATWTTLWDFTKSPLCVNGPILFEITATSSMADGAKVLIHYRNAEL